MENHQILIIGTVISSSLTSPLTANERFDSQWLKTHHDNDYENVGLEQTLWTRCAKLPLKAESPQAAWSSTAPGELLPLQVRASSAVMNDHSVTPDF
ncbi:hypothetical protein [Absidia glauca]|uniref:Uncharacterized protein n=1 Tax=Absidia glauca TaxID=4829 RepID=A0A168RMK4_ABSGL|nr:hypothetical protein [Absidia glauca]